MSRFVAVIVGHVVRGHEDDVVFGGVEFAVSAVDDFGLRKEDAGFGFEIGDGELVALGRWSFEIGLLLGECGGGKKKQREESDGHSCDGRADGAFVRGHFL